MVVGDLGLYLTRHHREDEADLLLQEISKWVHSDPNFRVIQGRILAARGLPEKAIVEFSVAIEADPASRDVYRDRGVQFYEIKNYEAAIDDFTKYLSFPISNAGGVASVHKRRGWAHFKLGDYQRALQDLDQTLDLRPHDLSVLQWIPVRDIAACYDPGFREGFLKLVDRVVELNESSVDSLLTRSMLRSALGDEAGAKQDLEAAVQLPPEDYSPMSRATGFNNLAWRYATSADPSVRNPQLGLQPANEANELVPDNAVFLNTLGVSQHARCGSISHRRRLERHPEPESIPRTRSPVDHLQRLVPGDGLPATGQQARGPRVV
jgi:tetratricopeptide (TPR) repeat protein